MQEKSPYVIGVDAGGTKTEVRLFSPHRLSLAVFRGPPFNGARHPPEALVETLQLALEKFREEHRISKITGICVGAAGVYHAHEKERVRQSLKSALPEVDEIWVLSDVEVAFYTMFENGPGILLIAGTGSVVFGRDENGKTYRAGGLGLLLDDEGSGSWIGLQAVRAAIKSREKRGPKTKLEEKILRDLSPRDYLATLKDVDADFFATLFPLVVDTAKQGDPVAKEIVEDAVQYLLDMVEGVRRQMGWTHPEFGYHGGLFRESEFRTHFIRQAESRGLQTYPLQADPSYGAAKYALQRLT